MKKTVLHTVILCLAILLLGACAKVGTGRVVIQGEIEGNPDEVVVVSYLPGQEITYFYPELHDGKFTFSMDSVVGFGDFIVSVGGVEFGARVNASDTLKMAFKVNRIAEDVEVVYDGRTEKESRVWTDFYNTYLYWGKYNLKLDSDPDIPFIESIALLERNDSIFRSEHKADLNRYYSHRADLAYSLLKAILLEQKAYAEDVDPYELPEYTSLLELVDPNDPDEITFPLINRWATEIRRGLGDDEITRSTGFMREYGGEMANPSVRAMLAKNMALFCMMDIDVDNTGKYEPLFAEIERFVPDNPEIVEACRAKMAAVLSSLPGSPVPEATLVTPDGNRILFSSLLGKVLYVDVWATWCGPCLNEGPYFKALAEKYKDDGRICFVSMSVDDTDAPWLEYLEKEKPFWTQVRLDESRKGDFNKKVDISTIPRFFLIDADGRFIDADCARPSSGEIESIIEKALE